MFEPKCSLLFTNILRGEKMLTRDQRSLLGHFRIRNEWVSHCTDGKQQTTGNLSDLQRTRGKLPPESGPCFLAPNLELSLFIVARHSILGRAQGNEGPAMTAGLQVH